MSLLFCCLCYCGCFIFFECCLIKLWPNSGNIVHDCHVVRECCVCLFVWISKGDNIPNRGTWIQTIQPDGLTGRGNEKLVSFDNSSSLILLAWQEQTSRPANKCNSDINLLNLTVKTKFHVQFSSGKLVSCIYRK